MKKLLLSAVVCSITSFGFSQELTPQVLSSAGTSFSNGSNVIDWTLGEPVTATLNNGTNSASQGFHQNDLLITTVEEQGVSSISLFPNPVVDVLNISFTNPEETNSIELFTVEGKLLSSQTVSSSALSKLDMGKYSSGTYLLKVKNKLSSKSFRIIKTK